MADKKDSVSITSSNIVISAPLTRYCRKTFDSLKKYVPKPARESVTMAAELTRVDRAHGNKYEASVRLIVGERTFQASDSTLNVFAALDIVRLKLAIALRNDAARRLPKGKNRV